MDADTVERLKTEGWPWDRLAEAVFARLDAERFAGAVLGDAGASENDRQVAAFELEEAMRLESFARGDVAQVLLVLLRTAIDERPNELFGLTMAFARSVYMKGLEAWLVSTSAGTGFGHLVELETRLHRAECELKKARGETWRLANALAALEQRIEQTERPADVRQPDSSASQATAQRASGGTSADGGGGQTD